MVGRAGFEPATHRFLRSDAYFLVVCLIGWVTLHETVEVYSVFVTVGLNARWLGSSTKLSYRPTKPLENENC